jgi:outer membrane protein assembly factor BamB
VKRLSIVLAAALAVAAGCAESPRRGHKNALPDRAEGVRPDVKTADLDPRGLDHRWSFFLGEPIRDMWILEDALYVFTTQRTLYALGLDDGFVRWQYKVGADLSFAPATYSYKKDGIARKDELFLVAKDVLHCVDKDAGYAMWRTPLAFGAASPPAASQSHVYVGSWDNRVYAIDKNDQSIGWTYRTSGPVTARPEPAEKTVEAVYVASEDGTVYAMNPVREERKWFFQTRGQVTARPLFFRNYVYVGSNDYTFYCIRALDGNLEWRYPTGAPITKEPVAFTRDTIYVVSGESNLLALNLQPDVKKQYVRWSFPKADQILAKGRRDLYVTDTDGDVVALADETGKPRWEKPLKAAGATHFALNPYEPTTLVERDKRLAATLVFGYDDGWIVAVKEKSEF